MYNYLYSYICIYLYNYVIYINKYVNMYVKSIKFLVVIQNLELFQIINNNTRT